MDINELQTMKMPEEVAKGGESAIIDWLVGMAVDNAKALGESDETIAGLAKSLRVDVAPVAKQMASIVAAGILPSIGVGVEKISDEQRAKEDAEQSRFSLGVEAIRTALLKTTVERAEDIGPVEAFHILKAGSAAAFVTLMMYLHGNKRGPARDAMARLIDNLLDVYEERLASGDDLIFKETGFDKVKADHDRLCGTTE